MSLGLFVRRFGRSNKKLPKKADEFEKKSDKVPSDPVSISVW